MKKILSMMFAILVIASVAYAAEVIEIGDLSPQIQKNRTSVQPQEFKVTSNEPLVVSAPEEKKRDNNKKVEQREANMVLSKNVKVLKQGQGFSYPLSEGDVIECYAKKLEGSIDDFDEYNDYFVMKDGTLYSNTLHKLYKPEKADELKLVDRVSIVEGGRTLKLYDPLWEPSVRRHKRTVKINLNTGEYYMSATQDNFTWYRKATTTGFCRVIKK